MKQERIYLAAPCGTEAQQAFNERIMALFDAYAIELVCPVPPLDEWALGAMETVAKSKVMLAVWEGGQLDPWTALLIGFARARHVPVVGIKHGGASGDFTALFERVVHVPADDNHLAGPLVNTVNLYL